MHRRTLFTALLQAAFACFVLQAATVHVARGILQAPILEASTFPGDAIYIPDSWFAHLRLCSNEHARTAWHEKYSRVRALDMHTPIHP